MTKFWFLFVAACVVIFAFFNMGWVDINLPLLEPLHVRSALAFTVTFILGGAAASVYWALGALRDKMRIRRLNKQIRDLESALPRMAASSSGPLPVREPNL